MFKARVKPHTGVCRWMLKLWERDQRLINVFGGYRIQDEVTILCPRWVLNFIHPTGPGVCPLQANTDFEWLIYAYTKGK